MKGREVCDCERRGGFWGRFVIVEGWGRFVIVKGREVSGGGL